MASSHMSYQNTVPVPVHTVESRAPARAFEVDLEKWGFTDGYCWSSRSPSQRTRVPMDAGRKSLVGFLTTLGASRRPSFSYGWQEYPS